MTYDNELERIVSQQVPPPEYPDPEPLLDVAGKRAEIEALKLNRPATKQEYLEDLARLRSELADLATQNTAIQAANAVARTQVYDRYQTLLDAARQDPENQREAASEADRVQDLEDAVIELSMIVAGGRS